MLEENTVVEPSPSDGRASIAELFRSVSEVEPAGLAIYFQDRVYTRGAVLECARSIAHILDEAQIPKGAAVAWVARNHPAMVAAALGLLMSERCVTLVNPHEPARRVASVVAQLRPCAIVASEADWTQELVTVAKDNGVVGITAAIDGPGSSVRFAAETSNGDYHRVGPDISVELLTSGTTGPPKRLPVSAKRLLSGLALGIRKDRGRSGSTTQDLTVKNSPSLIANPVSHVGGFFRVLLAVQELRPLVLRERFRVDEFVEDMRRFRPKAVGLVPAMANMVLEAKVPPEVFSSVIIVRSGTSPLHAETKAAFEETYKVPILSEYGATEFFGGVTAWTLGDYETFGAAKAASVGRPKKDVEVEVRDIASKEVLGPGAVGVLNVKSERFGTDWVATTDLGSIDEDGFVYIHGRADQAIVRGGFKVLPDQVADVLRQRDDVAEVCVIGVKDARLGEVPVAVIEPAPDCPPPSPEELATYAREHLAPYQVPVAYEIMASLPRTATMKIAIGEVREVLRPRYPA